MSWADIAAKNAPPPSEQPHPDQSLLEGKFDGAENLHQVDGLSGVSVAPHDFKEHPEISQNQVLPETIERDAEYAASQREIQIKAEVEKEYRKSKEYADELAVKAKAKGHEVEEDLKDAEVYAKKKAGEAENYLRKESKEAKEFIAKEAKDAKAFAKKEGAIVKKEAASLYNTLATQLSRPSVFVPLVGAIDAAIVGFFYYRSFIQRDARIAPLDQRTITNVSVGLGAIFSLQAFGANTYFANRDFTVKRQ